MAPRVRIYTTAYCGYCFMAKRLLEKRGISYEEIDLSRNREGRARIIAETGHRTVPVIFVEGRFIGGSDELHAMDRAGKLTHIYGTASNEARTGIS